MLHVKRYNRDHRAKYVEEPGLDEEEDVDEDGDDGDGDT